MLHYRVEAIELQESMNFTEDSSIEPFLKDFEAQYIAQQEAEHPDADATFNYGWALIRSKPTENVVKGRKMMQDLLSRGYSKTDCLYYIAMADYKLDNALVTTCKINHNEKRRKTK
mmetsp:Transcript_32578/g.127797  ORF Transcript_32578/g.127797 Transcript_32578/m.127797 type:complete len:116 (-) Transcript_32578:1865-2212(-)